MARAAGPDRVRPSDLLGGLLPGARLFAGSPEGLPLQAFAGGGVGFRPRRDEPKQTFFYGLRAHLPAHLLAGGDRSRGKSLAPADAHELWVAEELLEGAEGWAPWLTETIGAHGLASGSTSRGWSACTLQAYEEAREGASASLARAEKRRRIETVFVPVGRALSGQEGVGEGSLASDLWLRKILSHTMTFYLCQEGGGCSSPSRFSEFLVD